MKIQTESQQPPAASQAVEKHAGQREAPAQEKSAAATPKRQDTVELSAALDAELKRQEAEQAEKVAAIRARIAAGEYRVDSRAVAEKMLPERSGE